MENLEMFRHGAAAEAEEIEQHGDRGHHDDLVPLSILRLDLDPGEPWPLFLGRRGIAFRPDRIGRDAVTAGDAQRLIAEKREQELKKQRHLKVAEEAAVERDRAFRAALHPGIPWYALPDGVSYGQAAAAAEAAKHPSRTPSPGEWLFGETDTMVFHSLEGEDEA
jgi:hypothetical protein